MNRSTFGSPLGAAVPGEPGLTSLVGGGPSASTWTRVWIAGEISSVKSSFVVAIPMAAALEQTNSEASHTSRSPVFPFMLAPPLETASGDPDDPHHRDGGFCRCGRPTRRTR